MKCECGLESKRDTPTFPWHCACDAVWLSPTTRRDRPCRHLMEETGETVACRTCGSHTTEMPVIRCAVHVATIQRRHVPPPGAKAWDGMTCLDCKAQDLGFQELE